MATGGPVKPVPLIVLTVFVCAAASAVGGFCGLAASGIPDYGLRFDGRDVYYIDTYGVVGMWLGGGSGLLAAAIWCRVMIPLAIRKRGRSPVAAGTCLGLAVGLLSTALLHGGLMLLAEQWVPSGVTFGLLFGAPAGLIVGAICSFACMAAAQRACPGSGEEETERSS